MHSKNFNCAAPPWERTDLPDGAKANAIVYEHLFNDGGYHRLQIGHAVSPKPLTESIYAYTSLGIFEIASIDEDDVIGKHIAPYAPTLDAAQQAIIDFNEDEEYADEWH